MSLCCLYIKLPGVHFLENTNNTAYLSYPPPHLSSLFHPAQPPLSPSSSPLLPLSPPSDSSHPSVTMKRSYYVPSSHPLLPLSVPRVFRHSLFFKKKENLWERNGGVIHRAATIPRQPCFLFPLGSQTETIRDRFFPIWNMIQYIIPIPNGEWERNKWGMGKNQMRFSH